MVIIYGVIIHIPIYKWVSSTYTPLVYMGYYNIYHENGLVTHIYFGLVKYITVEKTNHHNMCKLILT